MIQIALCDDHDLVRTALADLLARDGGIRTALSVADGPSLLEGLEKDVRVDVIVLDLRLGGGGIAEGLGLIRRLRARWPHVGVLVVSMQEDPETVRRAIEAGALGFVGKGSAFDVLREAVVRVASGRTFVAPELAASLTLAQRPPGGGPRAGLRLTERESQVLQRLCEGLRAADIASELGIHLRTVSTCKARLMEKLQVADGAELLALCRQWRTGGDGN